MRLGSLATVYELLLGQRAFAGDTSADVRVVLMGRITPRGNGFVLDAELVNANDDSHIWGQQYDTNPAEILTTQAALARTLSESYARGLAVKRKPTW